MWYPPSQLRSVVDYEDTVVHIDVSLRLKYNDFNLEERDVPMDTAKRYPSNADYIAANVMETTNSQDIQKLGLPLNFIDLFAGCGGLSLGLTQARWRGLFGIERDPDAFSTFYHNLVNPSSSPFDWPEWLPMTHMDVSQALKDHFSTITQLRGQVGLVAGGPPCQGFSMAGKRNINDPRNQAFVHFIRAINILQPPLLLLENVPGIRSVFASSARSTRYSRLIRNALEQQCEYVVFEETVRSVDFGVAQIRPRHFIVGIRKDLYCVPQLEHFSPFDFLHATRDAFLRAKGLEPDRPISVEEAISDLEIGEDGAKLTEYEDAGSYRRIRYGAPVTDYQRMLHGDLRGATPNSLRLARHRAETTARFREMIRTCRKGVNLSAKERAQFGLRKSSLKILDKTKPSPTLTTLPDDIIHYSEPRILTVRESARLQSFPDWFEFRGKYTTGGNRRVHECPRYTQVANAVPPFLAEAIGVMLRTLLCLLQTSSRRTSFERS